MSDDLAREEAERPTLRERIEALAAEWEAEDPDAWDVHPTGVSAAYAAQYSIVTDLRKALNETDPTPPERADPWAAQPPSDAEVEAAARALWDQQKCCDDHWPDVAVRCRYDARAALIAAREVR